jgi:hypothetical protein
VKKLGQACLFRSAKTNPSVSFFFDEHGHIHIQAVEYERGARAMSSSESENLAGNGNFPYLREVPDTARTSSQSQTASAHHAGRKRLA